MTDENSERRFIERRSAHTDTDELDIPVPKPRPPADEVEPRVQTATEPKVETAVEEESPDVPRGAELDLEEMANVEIPEPSFYEIVQPLEIQALQFLGELPLTAEGQRGVLLHWAKHVIDLLGVLEDRTRGNLPPEESQYLEQVLVDLRMRYVRASS